jgi:homeobox protein ESX1
MLIFVFARFSYGLSGAILAEFRAVPNAPSDVDIPLHPVVADATAPVAQAPPVTPPAASREHGGPTGPEPTRFGDWERKGRCIDF